MSVLDYPDFVESLCAQTDPDLFFPGFGESPEGARRICRRCVSIVECRVYALERPELAGVWGGLSGRQRTVIRRKAERESGLRSPALRVTSDRRRNARDDD